MKIALAGNPNSGKTTLYNALTGKTEQVGNWAGVTVEKKVSALKGALNKNYGEVTIVDLPGAYSMSPYTKEESITKDFVQGESPDVIINIVDATNLSRSLFFTTQLAELGIPVVIALNKSDMAKKKGVKVDLAKLREKLSCKVVETVSTATTGNGLDELLAAAVSSVGQGQSAPYSAEYAGLTDVKAVEEADKARFAFVDTIVRAVETRLQQTSERTKQDAADAILAHKWIGLPIFAAVMWAVFAISQTYVGPLLADIFVGWIDAFNGFVGGMLGEDVSPVLSAILLDGIIGGVGAVIGFLPLIMVMFFLLALLEDCGYMARVAVIMDRFFKVVGLSGKSIIPMVIGTGCAIPGIMATRTIKDERQRRTTAMLTPFIPCGAKLPVIALFAGVFFSEATWVSPLMYFVGIFLIILGALFSVKITGEKYARSYFIIELPEYKFPSIKRAALSMLSRAKAYIIKASTIILLCNMAVQILQTFTLDFQVVAELADAAALQAGLPLPSDAAALAAATPAQFEAVRALVETYQSQSILAAIASPFALLLIPVGFGVWQLAAAAITGFIAKENVVGTLAVVYGINNFIDTDALELTSGATEVAGIMGMSSVAALAYLMFNLYTPPCFAAIGAMNAEMESGKWLWGGIALQFGTGYVVAFLVYQIGTLITMGTVGAGFVPGLIAVAVMIGVLVMMMMRGGKKSGQKLPDKVAA